MTHIRQSLVVIPLGPVLNFTFPPEGFQQRSLRNTPLRHQSQSPVRIASGLPNDPSSLSIWMLSWTRAKEKIDSEGVVALEDGESDGVGWDEGGSESLHAIVVDEASGRD